MLIGTTGGDRHNGDADALVPIVFASIGTTAGVPDAPDVPIAAAEDEAMEDAPCGGVARDAA